MNHVFPYINTVIGCLAWLTIGFMTLDAVLLLGNAVRGTSLSGPKILQQWLVNVIVYIVATSVVLLHIDKYLWSSGFVSFGFAFCVMAWAVVHTSMSSLALIAVLFGLDRRSDKEVFVAAGSPPGSGAVVKTIVARTPKSIEKVRGVAKAALHGHLAYLYSLDELKDWASMIDDRRDEVMVIPEDPAAPADLQVHTWLVTYLDLANLKGFELRYEAVKSSHPIRVRDRYRELNRKIVDLVNDEQVDMFTTLLELTQRRRRKPDFTV